MIEDWIVKRIGIIDWTIDYSHYDTRSSIQYNNHATSTMRVDLDRFENFIDELYEEVIEQKIREEVPAIKAAYEKYRTLLELAKSEIQ